MSSPARKIKKSAVKNIVRFPAIKANGGKAILVESILESNYCYHLEFDPSVEEYFPQPQTFPIPDQNNDVNSYTPDFKVHYIDGTRKYVEVKPLEFAKSNHFQDIFSRFETYLSNSNVEFLQVDEFEINRLPLLENYKKLYQYKKRPSLDMRTLHQSAESIAFAIPLSILVSRLHERVRLREIYTWLALGYLRFDMETEILSMRTEVKFDVR